MEFTLTSGDLAKAIGLIKGVIEQRTTIPIIGHVLLDTAGGKLTITGTNMDMEASIVEPAEIIAHGRTTVPGHVLFGLAKSLPKTKLATLKIEDHRAILTCGKSRYDLGTLAADDFPIMAAVDGGATITLPASDLRAGLSATRSNASDEETRFYLAGVHVTTENGKLAFVATNGHQLSQFVTDVDQDDDLPPNIIIPSSAVQNILAVIEGSDGEVTMKITGRRIEVTCGSVRLVSKLIEGTYPDYRRVIPRYNSEPNFTASAAEVSEAVNRLATIVMGNDKINPAVKITTNGSAIDVSLRGQNTGSETIDAVIGAKTEFGANVKYLTAMIGLWPNGSTLKVTAPDAGSPILIMSDDLPNQTQVLMPMRA